MTLPRLGRRALPQGALALILWCTALAGCSSFPSPFASSAGLFPVVMEHAVPGLSGVQRFAAWSPDGRTLALMSNAAGNWDVWTIGIDGTRLQQLTHDPSNEYTATWSPDGGQLVFSSDRLHRVWPNLWMLNPRRPGAVEQLSPGDGKYFFPSWSPDGTHIAFVYLPTGPPAFELRVMSVLNREIRVLSRDGILFSPPAWSPDGSKIAFASNRTGNAELWVMDVSSLCGVDLDDPQPSAAFWQLTEHPAMDKDPSWSPDGRYLAFTSTRSGNEALWVMKLPDFSRLPPSLLPSSEQGGQKEQRESREPRYSVRHGAFALQQLTHDPAIDRYPQWSPDGKQIAFTSTRSGHETVWLIDLGP
jgi:Tol biopolymer transport system component